METHQLEYLMYHHPTTINRFGGILARDQLPLHATHRCYIVNTDTSQEAGTHWVALFFDSNGLAEYFDSYGLPPHLPEIKHFLSNNCVNWKYNAKLLQSVRFAVCGQYCIYFLLFRCTCMSMSRIVHPFSNEEFIKNDKHVRQYIYKMLHI